MARKISLSAEVEPTYLNVDVTAAPGGSGDAVAYTSASSAAILTNLSGGGGLQYKIDSGTWNDLARHEGINLPVNLAISALYLRRTLIGGGPVTAHLAVESIPAITAGASGIMTSISDAAGNALAIMGASRRPIPGTQQSAPGNVLTKYGKLAFDLTLGDIAGTKTYVPVATNNATGIVNISYTAASSTLSTDFTRFSNVSRKVTVTSNNSQIRFNNLNILVDPVDKALEISVYIPTIPSELLGSSSVNPGFTIRFSNNLGGTGGLSESWLYDGSSLRQGWNTLRMFADDYRGTTSEQGKNDLPAGVAHAGSSPIDWTQPIQYMEISFSNWLNLPFGASGVPTQASEYSMYFDQLRKAAMATPVLIIGFDAAGANLADDIFITKVAPLFAQYGVKGYVTATGAAANSVNSGDLTYAGGADWARRLTLQYQFGWDVINHTWNHGGMGYGRIVNSLTVSRTSNLVTATIPTHGINIGTTFKVNITNATSADLNGVFTATVTTATQFTYTAAGADVASSPATLRTIMSEAINADTPENRAIMLHEIKDMSDCMRGTGLARAAHIAAFPNNSVPHLGPLSYACQTAGVKYARGSRNGYTPVNEFGPDNPLHCGSFELGSTLTGALSTDEKMTLAYIKAKINGAVRRGEHLWLYGHFIVDESKVAGTINTDYPPGYSLGGVSNPVQAPAGGAAAGGGWWYLGTLEKLLRDCVAPLVAAGKLRVMTPSEWAAFLGNPQ